MVRYWKEEYREPVTLTDKRFNELRQLYIDCFETLCRLLVLARGYEMIRDSMRCSSRARRLWHNSISRVAMRRKAVCQPEARMSGIWISRF